MQAHKLAPPDAGFAPRLRALAEAAASEQVAWEHAHAAGLLWRPVPGAESAEPPYELRPGTGRRGPGRDVGPVRRCRCGRSTARSPAQMRPRWPTRSARSPRRHARGRWPARTRSPARHSRARPRRGLAVTARPGRVRCRIQYAASVRGWPLHARAEPFGSCAFVTATASSGTQATDTRCLRTLKPAAAAAERETEGEPCRRSS